MSADNAAGKLWSNAEAYGLAAICLALGIVAGYLIHGPKSLTVTSASPSPTSARAVPQAPIGDGMQVSKEGLEHMAVKQAEPLMAKLEKNPNDPDLLAQIGKVYLVAHQFESATKYYERAVKIKSDPRTLTTLGGAYHLAGADDRALGAWKRALQADPTYADALFNYGLIKWKSESDPNAAIAAWNKLLQTNPNHPQRARVEEMIARAKKDAETAATK
jgi:cytochrome c-type biogenesis protein CcmH/NrfG